tara:strand:- start:213 stop:1199 length:987 start_codon:yes stop_codon:yes gene_type:complete
MLYTKDNLKFLYKNVSKKIINAIPIIITLIFSFTFADNRYDLDDFEDLDLNTLEKRNIKKNIDQKKSQRLILFDDNLYLLDDDFDLGSDEIELQKLELNPQDMETAREYEEFLNIFFENSMSIGNNQFGNRKNTKNSVRKSSIRGNSLGGRNENKGNLKIPRGRFGFGVSTMFGATIPMGTNLKTNFSTGSNFGIHISTPISFNIANMELKTGTEIYFSSMNSINAEGSPYKLTNIAGTVSIFPMKSIEVKTGLGLSPSNIGDYSKVLFSIPVDINYYLPFNLKGFGLALNLHAQETLGIPTDVGTEDSKATSEFINLGFFITTPLVF